MEDSFAAVQRRMIFEERFTHVTFLEGELLGVLVCADFSSKPAKFTIRIRGKLANLPDFNPQLCSEWDGVLQDIWPKLKKWQANVAESAI